MAVTLGLKRKLSISHKRVQYFSWVIVSDSPLPDVDLVDISNLAHHSLSVEDSSGITQTSEVAPMSIPSFFTVIPVQLTGFFLIVFILFFFFFFLRLRRQMGPSSHIATSPSSSSAAVPLDLDVLKSLPSAVFRSATDAKAGNALECAVCLSELTDGEVARLLPRCHHAFHLACIDTWFLFNSTCPICRSAVELPPASEPSTFTEEDVNRPALERLRSRGEDSSFSSGGRDVEIGIRFANEQRVAVSREVSERG